MRSLLIAPGDDAAKLDAALKSGADAVVIDLAVAPGAKAAARAGAARILENARADAGGPALMVRVSPLGDDETDLDLDAVMPGAPGSILLPRLFNAASVQHLSVKLAVREALLGLDDGATRIIAVADSARGTLGLPTCRGASARLAGLAWDAEGLRADLGAEACRDGGGAYAGPFRAARDMTLLAAAAAGVAAIDTAFAGAGDADALRAEALAARRDGFSGKFVADADQARVVNEIFGLSRKSVR